MERNSLLPSKRFILILLCILVAAATLWLAYDYFNADQYKGGDTAELQVDEVDLDDDFDQDSLKNWEEYLWKTDPSNPDTDNDGMPDGEEVLTGRDPRTPGVGSSSTEPSSDVDSTNQLAQVFVSEYFGLKQQGASLDESTQTKLVDNITTQSSFQQKTAIYTRNNLTIGNISTTLALYGYGNKLGSILINNSTQSTENEIDIFYDAITKENPDRLKDLDSFITYYGTVLNQSLNLSVPEVAARAHLNLINSFHFVLLDLRAMRAAFDDPLGATAAISQYRDSVELMARSLADVGGVLLENDVHYENNEHGSVLFSTI